MKLENIRAQLRKEYRRTDAAFDRHIEATNCHSDSCSVRARYQERLATLNYAIKALGGRATYSTTTTIEDLAD